MQREKNVFDDWIRADPVNMERHILLLLMSTGLVTAQFNVTRYEGADNFVWTGVTSLDY